MNWKEIPNFNGYFVNEVGQVKSFRKYSDGKLLSPYIDKDGYACVSMYNGEKQKAMKIHRLVGIVFLVNPNNYPQINHKDGNKLNNHVSNLEWASNIQNQRHAWNSDLRTIKLKVSDVSTIKKLIKDGFKNFEIAKTYNVDPSIISNIRHNKIWRDVA